MEDMEIESMAISKSDRELMERVAEYFESTRKTVDPKAKYKPKREDSRSVNDTARHFNITRAKTTKMLITMGVLDTPISKAARELRTAGMSVKDIAEELGVSVGTVSSNLPYEDEIHGSDEVSGHALAMREYRAYERMQKERQDKMKGSSASRTTADGNAGDIGKMDDADGAVGDWKSEWEKEKKMSYKADFSRPPRITWENVSEMIDDEEYEGLQEHLKARETRDAALRTELEKLQRIPSDQLTDEQRERVEDLIMDLGLYPGALNDRNHADLEKLSGERIPFEPQNVTRLHLELVSPWMDEDDLEALRAYGNVKGRTISRDVVVPSNIPLYALHYVIQRVFGWQNSHLHEFELTINRMKEFCENGPELWRQMVGIVFRSPYMDEDAQFWADDYETGSFKNWLRKKYTGPYLSQCREEGLYSSFYDVQDIGPETELYVGHGKIDVDKGLNYTEAPYFAGWVENGAPRLRAADDRVEKMMFKDYPLDRLFHMFGVNPFALLERLPLDSVLCPGFDRLLQSSRDRLDGQEDCEDLEEQELRELLEEEAEYLEVNTCKTATEELTLIDAEMDAAFRVNEDSPYNQVLPMPFATELLYTYDFCDGWHVRITGSDNCVDMVEEGIVDQLTLDRANIKCRETYRPVLIARDGDMVLDDVGGLSGFAGFLRAINPDLDEMSCDEKAAVKAQQKEILSWAKSQGWKRNDASNMNLL